MQRRKQNKKETRKDSRKLRAKETLAARTAARLFDGHEEKERFLAAIEKKENPFQGCILWTQSRPDDFSPKTTPTEIGLDFVEVWEDESRPGKHSLHDAGFYYCLDFSSIVAASVLTAIPQSDRPKTILDLCASPGGKAVFAWRLFKPDLLIANEVIGKRIPALRSNLSRCATEPYEILNLDPGVICDQYENQIDLAIVDAPCSGQSILAKGETNPGCFHPTIVNRNANRQKRILANAIRCVRSGGYIAYMTCTYSEEENEKVVRWLLKKFPELTPIPVPHLERYQSHLADFPAYRVWPQNGQGAGSFSILLKLQ